MFNLTEDEERQYLETIIDKLDDALDEIDKNVNRYVKELQEQKTFLWENKNGMDAAEKGSFRQSISSKAITGEAAVALKARLRKLMISPYFGRIDFVEDGTEDPAPVYIGIHSFFDEANNDNLIHDWRAPVSGMFYDYELGKAAFESPSGEKTGDIVRKRQYRIQNGEMEFMLESEMQIRDDVLQKELSRAADDKMKNIVATIQRDQNAIIRNETSPVLIIQGVAGSGKTSIALHRIAFLLYRYKDSITSRDILIISPNKVFADYISNVLPELGEDSIPEMGIDSLAMQILEGKFKFQSFFEQVTLLLDKQDPAFIERMRFKASYEFMNKLKEYTNWLRTENFVEADIPIRRKVVPARFVQQRFISYEWLPMFRRLNEITRDVVNKIRTDFRYHDLTATEKNKIRSAIKKMFRSTNVRTLYKEFYTWLDRPELFKYARKTTLEYADVFPMAYLKMRLEGFDAYKKVKHLLVDEMQDYTPVQYEVLSRLFPCNKTILGDANQSVNPYSSTTSKEIQRVFTDADAMTMLKSYRSTWEITKFGQQISGSNDIEAVERHGDEPEVNVYKKADEEIGRIRGLILEFNQTDYHTLGIICKTQKLADRLFDHLEETAKNIHLISEGSTSLSSGVIVTTAHHAKGLEFDNVIVPHVTAEIFATEIDKSMLYIACTRAMHRLTLTCVGNKSTFL
ncbi:MAG: UvrD-helicase domain-containing protein [Balneolales bacterium]